MAAERDRCDAGRGFRLALLRFQLDAADIKLATAQQRFAKGAARACGKEIRDRELQSAVLASRRRGNLNDIEPRAFRASSLGAGYSPPTRGFVDDCRSPERSIVHASRRRLLKERAPHRLDLGLRFSEFGQEFEGFYGFVVVDAAHGVAVDDLGERVGEISLRIDVVSLARLDQRGENRPMLGAAVGAALRAICGRP